jgi:4-hydroxyphenylpyruvate dioxygenase-like putative hemolysin
MDNFLTLGDIRNNIHDFFDYYNNHRYHKSTQIDAILLNKETNMKTKTIVGLTVICLVITGSVTTIFTDKNDLNGAGMLQANAQSFNEKKIVQIGIVVNDVKKYAKNYAAFFGVEIPKVIISETEDKAKTQYHGQPTMARVRQAFFHFENISIELLEPVGGPSTWREFLDNNGEGIHHIAFEIKGMDERISEMQEKGIDLIQQGRWTDYSGGRYAYFDSNAKLAMILELLENF